MARENKTKYAILGLLASKPGSGYDIRKRFKKYAGLFWSESYGQIYPAARQLVNEGLATISIERTEGKPERHVYSITEMGILELQEWLARPPAPHRERLEILIKLVFGSRISIEENLELMLHFREESASHLKGYSEIGAVLSSAFEGDPQLPYWMMVVQCGMKVSNAYLDWCDETILSLCAMRQNVKR